MSDEKPDECEGCGWATPKLTRHVREGARHPVAYLCDICRQTEAGFVPHYRAPIDLQWVLRVLVYCTHLVLEEIRGLRADVRKAARASGRKTKCPEP